MISINDDGTVEYTPDPRETTLLVRIYGLGEPIETSITAIGEREDRERQVTETVAAIVESETGLGSLVAWSPRDADGGVVLDGGHLTPCSPEGETVSTMEQASRYAVASYTVTDVAPDMIERWLATQW